MRTDMNKTKIDLGNHYRAILMAIMAVALLFPNLSQAKNVSQQRFASPDAAVKAMVETLQSKDFNTLEVIFGPNSRDLISSGDPIADQSGHAHFLKLYEEKNRVELTADKGVLLLGNDDWPFPIPS